MDLSRNQLIAAVTLASLALIGLSVGSIRSSIGGGGSDITITEPDNSSARDVNLSVEDKPDLRHSTPEASALVHVAGRVRFPNVYRLPPGSRVIDAVKAAGGSLPDACLDAVNLAAKIHDGEQIYLPSRRDLRVGQRAASGRPASSSPYARPSSNGSSSEKLREPGQGFVNINTADSAEMQRLPGVGPSTAQKIIDYRAQIGRFSSVEQLMDVRGIGEKKLEKMRPFIVF